MCPFTSRLHVFYKFTRPPPHSPPQGHPLQIVQRLADKYRDDITNTLRVDIYSQPIMSNLAGDVVHAPGADLLSEQLQGRT
jgi:hypothetical protein